MAKKKKNIKKSASKPAKQHKKPTSKSGFAYSDYNRVRSVLWKKFGKDWKGSYLDFIKKDSPLSLAYYDCKAYERQHGRKRKCGARRLIDFYKRHIPEETGAPPKKKPALPGFTEPRHYYELDTSVTYGLTWDVSLWITSDLLQHPGEVRGVDYDYDRRPSFKDFIAWANKYKQLGYFDSEVNLWVRFTEVEFNEAKKWWETRVVLCDADGKEYTDPLSDLFELIKFYPDDVSDSEFDIETYMRRVKYPEESPEALTKEEKEKQRIADRQKREQEEKERREREDKEKKPSLEDDEKAKQARKEELEKIKAQAEALRNRLRQLEAEQKLKETELQLIQARQAERESFGRLFTQGIITKTEFRKALKKLGYI